MLEEAGSRQCGLFARGAQRLHCVGARHGEIYAKIGQLECRTGFLGQEARAMSAPDRRAMVEEGDRCAADGACPPRRGGDYLATVLHPRTASRTSVNDLRTNKEGRGVKNCSGCGGSLVGIEALVPRLAPAKPRRQKTTPLLLPRLKIVEPNLWAADATYIPMAFCGFLSSAIIDWASRAVLAWRLSKAPKLCELLRRPWRGVCSVWESCGFSNTDSQRLFPAACTQEAHRPTGAAP